MRCISSDVQVKCLNEKKHFVLSPTGELSNDDNYQICFNEEKQDDCRIGTLKLNILRKNTWDMTGLALDAPIQIALELDEIPEKMTCMYMFNEWWTRPAFITEVNKIPEKTQIIFCKYKNYYSCFFPMVGNIFKTTACSGELQNRMYLKMEAGIGGLRQVDEAIYLVADGYTLENAIRKIFQYISKNLGVKLREKRTFPEFLQYLGWCSWDAFYKEISEEKIRKKADELVEKQVPVRWMLFDDGWMNEKDDMLCAYEADKEKFPVGFNSLITDIKQHSKISWFGVWHAFGGYWAGVDPKCELAQQEKEYLYSTINGRLVPSPISGAGFYQDWYQLLKKQQIDFVKVDGQSAVPIYFQQDQPTVSAARGMNRELEKGAEMMNGNVINCMGMAMENILARPNTGISRNSDDFVPNREGGFEEHLLQNAYNALYHNEIYYCDWDMFWTKHPDAEKHSILRAVSGGPVYFSDRIGETDPKVLKKLCYQNGKLLLMKRSAKPTEDMIFTDPLQTGILKLQNIGVRADGKTGGVIVAFNLTEKKQEAVISIKDIPELDDDKSYWLYNYFSKSAELLHKGQEKKFSLNSKEYAYYILLPSDEPFTCLGLIEKYAGFLAVKMKKQEKNRVSFEITETGSVAWMTEKKINKVILNGKNQTDKVQKNGCVYELKINNSLESMVLELESLPVE